MEDLAKSLIAYTVKNSNYYPYIDHISLSKIYKPIDELFSQIGKDIEESENGHLLCYKGYQMEKDIVERLKKIYHARIKVPEYPLINLYDGLVKGHADFLFDGFPGEVKSVLEEEKFPKNGTLKIRTYYQLQAYMLYLKKDYAVVVYEERKFGKIYSQWIKEDKTVQKEIEDKIQELISLIKNKH